MMQFLMANYAEAAARLDQRLLCRRALLGLHRQWRPGPGRLIVTNRLGAPARRSSFGHCRQVVVESCGLPTGTRFHDLRHFYASALIRAGLHPRAIQARLGHATMAETMDTYGHLFPDAEDYGRGAIDALLTAADEPQVCPEDQAQ